MPEGQVALLRGINVGKAKRVAMADLRRLVAELGYGDVKTLLNSGNVVFSNPNATAAEAALRIEAGLRERLGVASRVVVLTSAELAQVLAENPLLETATNPSRLLAAVWYEPADRARLAPLAGEAWGDEAFALGRRAAYLWCPEGQIKSRLAAAVARAGGDAITVRNWSTLTKLQALVAAAG